MAKLLSRDQAKRMAGKDTGPTDDDDVWDALLEASTDVVTRYCDRDFLKQQYVELHESYEQSMGDPQPQLIWLKAYPVDLNQPLVVSFAADGNHAAHGSALVLGSDYLIDAAGKITILPRVSDPSVGRYFPGYRNYADNIAGFQVTYTGGFSPVTGYEDYIDAPVGLRAVIAMKVAADFGECKCVKPWLPEQLAQLNPYRRKNVLFG